MLRSLRPFPLAAALLCLTGLLFCLWVHLTGGKALCLTDGCTLFQDFRLAGVSLWQAGTVLFAALLLLALPRLVRAALHLSFLALAADTVLLGVMVFTAPCVNCLVVGALIALSFLAFRRETLPADAPRSSLAVLWLILFIVNFGGVLRDLADPWSPLPARQEQTSVQVYFSPSCPACRTLVSLSDELSDADWYPVPEDTRDIWLIAAMTERLEQGMSLQKAVEEVHEAVPSAADFDNDLSMRLGLLRPDMLFLQFRLWRNHAHVLAAGSNRLPFVEFMGLPAFLAEPPAPAPEEPAVSDLMRQDIPGLQDFGVAGFCDHESEEPCEEPPLASPGNLIDTSGMILEPSPVPTASEK